MVKLLIELSKNRYSIVLDDNLEIIKYKIGNDEFNI